VVILFKREKEIFKWCPNCNKEELSLCYEPKFKYGSTDGYGQPVRFSECECGKEYGWFEIGFYRWRDNEFVFDDSFKSYLKSRINHYFRGQNK
jgi:hypothetical protein